MGMKHKEHSAQFKPQAAMAAISGEKTPAGLSPEYVMHPTMISTRKQELARRAAELFERGAKKAAEGERLKTIGGLYRHIGQLNQLETTMPAILMKPVPTADNLNLPSKTGEPSSKGGGNNPPKGT